MHVPIPGIDFGQQPENLCAHWDNPDNVRQRGVWCRLYPPKHLHSGISRLGKFEGLQVGPGVYSNTKQVLVGLVMRA